MDAEGEASVKALSFGYVSIKTRDLEESVRFRGEAFRLEKIPTYNSPGASVIRCLSDVVRKEAARYQKRFELWLENSLRLGCWPSGFDSALRVHEEADGPRSRGLSARKRRFSL